MPGVFSLCSLVGTGASGEGCADRALDTVARILIAFGGIAIYLQLMTAENDLSHAPLKKTVLTFWIALAANL